MLLGSLRVLTWGDLRAFNTTLKFINSQVPPPLTLNRPPKHLSSQWLTKPLLLPWKLLRIPTKAVAKERRLKTLKAWIKIKIRRRILLTPHKKPLTLLPLSLAKLLTQKSPKQQFRIGYSSYFYLLFVVLFVLLLFFLFFIFYKECIIFSLLSMKTFFFCFIHSHNACYEIRC